MTKHRKAWTEIAEAYLTPYGEKTERQFALSYYGLCWASRFQQVEFDWRLNKRHYFWWPLRGFDEFRPKHDTYRGMAALLIAEMGEREFNKLLKECENGTS